jgi:two-component system cell cycle sensor histidine kinase/response regulator CckA
MPPHTQGPTRALRIIVADDNPEKIFALSQTLREAGHCVFSAYDGGSALELVAVLPRIDLLVTNSRLGFVDGPTLMQRTRELDPGLPILHLVDRGSDADEGQPPDVVTLREPFTPEQLLTAVESLLA